jgi:hypothetical protein
VRDQLSAPTGATGPNFQRAWTVLRDSAGKLRHILERTVRLQTAPLQANIPERERPG